MAIIVCVEERFSATEVERARVVAADSFRHRRGPRTPRVIPRRHDRFPSQTRDHLDKRM